MKYIAIIDDDMLNENDKRELRVPILEKDGISYVNLKPLVTHIEDIPFTKDETRIVGFTINGKENKE